MDGLFHIKKDTSLESITQKSGSLSLLAKFGDLEVMEQTIKKDKKFYIYPGDKKGLFEFFYVIEGVIFVEETGKRMTSGDIFYVHELKTPVYFKTEKETKLLYLINDHIFAHLSENIKKLTKAISKVEEKDIYTDQHSNRVMEMAVLVAEHLDMNINIPELSYAALFHDLGKIDIPTDILQKSGKLTDEEYDVIKKHPALGKMIAEDIRFIHIGDIIEQHHERIDGKGYPNGLKGDAICIEAKIIAVVDSFDAMTSDRPYRKGMTKQAAIQELLAYKGTCYDATVVDTFIELIEKEYPWALSETHTA